MWGAWAAFLGWGLGRIPATLSPLARAGFKGLALGLSVALVLSLLDSLWNYSPRQLVAIVPRVIFAALIGSMGGLISGVIGQALYEDLGGPIVQVIGWTFAGALIGSSQGAYDLVARVLRKENIQGAARKCVNSILGGTLGGLIGSLLLLASAGLLFAHKAEPWLPGALGFVTLGACIGLLIGTSQVLFSEAWLSVEAGFRPGREWIVTKPVLTIGRAESCDIGLFGDNTVERLHARLDVEGNRYVLADAGSAAGTFVNEQRLTQPTALRSGDYIRVGRNLLRFGQRHKQRS